MEGEKEARPVKKREQKTVGLCRVSSALISLLLVAVLVVAASQGSAVAGFQIPEKFVYSLTWAGIKAGTASLEVVKAGDTVRIISTARSASWVSVFYTVEDRIVSTLLKDPTFSYIGLPTTYRVKIREGRHRRDKEVIFDRAGNKAQYINHLKNEKREYEVPPGVFDPISGFYHLRSVPLKVGESVYVTIFDSKKVWNVEVQVLRREKITLPIGSFDTVVVKPVLQSEGIFFRKGDVFIWLTDDAKHIPVKVQTKVAIGHVNATLVQGAY